MPKGSAFVISAPSGAGKSTLVKRLLDEFPDICYSISCTSRSPRAGEIHGKDYFFLTVPEFRQLIDEHKLVEWAEVHGNYYGTPLEPVERALSEGKDILFDIDTQGAAQIKLSLSEAHFIFILPPSLAELKLRLINRGLDKNETVLKRLENAPGEISAARWYDAVIINDNLDLAYASLRSLYLCAKLTPQANKVLINKLLQEKI